MKFTPIKLWMKSIIFMSISGLFVILDIFLAYRHLYVVTGYLFIVTVFIIFILHRYRESPREVKVPELQLAPVKENQVKLNFSELLLREFDYVKETAAQAMNDRLTLVNYFLLSAGVVLASFGLMVSYEGAARFAYRHEVLIALCLIFNSVGWVYFMQIIRLRQAWCESARAMNHLKLLFVKNSELLPVAVKGIFRWEVNSIPPAGKKMTVFYLSAVLIGILNAAALAFASIIVLCSDLLRASDEMNKPLAIPLNYLAVSFSVGLYHLFFQMSMYTALLEEPAMPNEEHKQESGTPSDPAPKNTSSKM